MACPGCGYDTVGHVVACQSPFEGPEEAFSLVGRCNFEGLETRVENA